MRRLPTARRVCPARGLSPYPRMTSDDRVRLCGCMWRPASADRLFAAAFLHVAKDLSIRTASSVFPKSAAVATRKVAWGWVGFEIHSAAEQYRRQAMLPTR